MKKFLVAGLIMCLPVITNAQLGSFMNRAKAKVNARINAKADETVDKTLDDVEGKKAAPAKETKQIIN